MTNKSDTPFTDAYEHNMGSVALPHYVVDSEHVRNIERELNALKEKPRIHTAQRYTVSATHAFHDSDGKWVFAEDHERELAALKAENELMRPVVESAVALARHCANYGVPHGMSEVEDVCLDVHIYDKVRSTK